MTRVYSGRPHNGAHGASTLDRARTIRKKKPYKILFEAVTQEKKKLHSILTYTADAPLGYSFVPAGHPDLTEYCKERCRTRNLDVHIVSAKPRSKAHENPEKISHHVHRIGFHFPNEVISEACDMLGYYVRNGVYHKSARDHNSTRLARSLANYGQRMALHGRPATETESKTQVRDAVREMFPKIPEKDLSAIVSHAFQEGSKRVGNATELTLARRVQLAVVAHIRHTYTDYDRLLKVGSWLEARAKVEHVSLAKLRQWRDEADSDELEETFREVIVIDDDDDDDSSDEESFSGTDQREPSLEIVSSRATARELQHNELDDVARVDAHSVSRAPRRTIFLRPMHPASSSSAVAGTLNAYSAEQVPWAHARPAPSALPVRPTLQQYQQPLYLAHGRPMEPYVSPFAYRFGSRSPSSRLRSSVFEPVRSQHPLQMRDEDGKLYNVSPRRLRC
ncbi:hypothetical protein K505DRAFT_300582 [Melanomma pulvis-pyrius CBS 109.77]|uniref:DUF2293 domain-containing protein n=1 Tax=Melanomma pulvis-pyrius CBS 109.77 TaxID=1314802 RepID=A0A6A6XIB9_9PLEO|nr:hypothetical protein K505DRAFT_300582 [Melanomma pulvis-pyrius CBS 109.77]